MSHASPVNGLILSPDEIRALCQKVLGFTTADTTSVTIQHVASGVARVVRGQVQLASNGDRLSLEIVSGFGAKLPAILNINQLDDDTLRDAIRYLERVASQNPGDAVDLTMPVPARTYLPNTAWKDTTAAAFNDARHGVIQSLVRPARDAGLTTAAFAGAHLMSRGYADKQGLSAADQESDVELNVTAWNPGGKGSGWAGQAARDWSVLKPEVIAAEAVRLTKLAADPVAFEPGRRVVILDRPAMAQIVRAMASPFDAYSVLVRHLGPLWDRQNGRARLGERIMDSRITMSSDPNDAEGGYLPFNGSALPLSPQTWIENGVVKNLAYRHGFAAQQGVMPPNDPPVSMRVSGGPTTVDEMIANCKEGIYVNRFSQIDIIDFNSGALSGFTNGACLLIRNGKIEKSLKHYRFFDSPWHFLNRLEAIGPTERTAFGYAPWHSDWPIPPSIVPPVMVRDFNFTALAESV